MEFKPRRKRNVYTSPNDKLKAVERVVLEGISTRIIAEELSVSLTSVQTWVKQYNDFGPEYFTTQVRSSDGPDAIQAELERLKKIEKAYEEQLIEVEILKKFQAFLKMK